jgi:hypothetical protein
MINNHTYSSPKDYLKEINLKPINSHYTFNSTIKSYLYHINFNKKLIMIYNVLENEIVTTYKSTIKLLIIKKMLGK